MESGAVLAHIPDLSCCSASCTAVDCAMELPGSTADCSAYVESILPAEPFPPTLRKVSEWSLHFYTLEPGMSEVVLILRFLKSSLLLSR